MRDCGLQVIWHHDLHHPTEELEGPRMRPDPAPQVLSARGLGEGVAAGAQHRYEHGRGVDLTALRIVNRNRGPGVVHEHLLAGAVLLPQHQVEFLQPPPVEIAEAAIAIALRVALAPLLPDQLQSQVFVGLQILVDLRPIRLRVLAPNNRSGPLRKQRLLDLLVPPVLRNWPLQTCRLGGGHVLMDSALGNGTTAGDLMLAQSERMEPQNFLQLAHGQPLLWQLGSPLPVEPSRHGCPAPSFQSDADHRSELQL
jgi:hypothetical protein